MEPSQNKQIVSIIFWIADFITIRRKQELGRIMNRYNVKENFTPLTNL